MGHAVHTLFVVLVHGVDSYVPGGHVEVQRLVAVSPRQYELAGHAEQTRLVSDVHGVVW